MSTGEISASVQLRAYRLDVAGQESRSDSVGLFRSDSVKRVIETRVVVPERGAENLVLNDELIDGRIAQVGRPDFSIPRNRRTVNGGKEGPGAAVFFARQNLNLLCISEVVYNDREIREKAEASSPGGAGTGFGSEQCNWVHGSLLSP